MIIFRYKTVHSRAEPEFKDVAPRDRPLNVEGLSKGDSAVKFARFELNQKFVSKTDLGLTAEVVELLDDGHDAHLDLRKDGVLQRGQPTKYVRFIEYWDLVEDGDDG